MMTDKEFHDKRQKDIAKKIKKETNGKYTTTLRQVQKVYKPSDKLFFEQLAEVREILKEANRTYDD